MSNIRKKRMGKSSEARGARSIKEDVSGTQGEGRHSCSGATHKPETRDSRKAIPPAARTTSFDCPSHGYVKDGSRGTLCNVVQTSVSGMLFPQLSPRIVRGLDQEFLLALRRVWPLSRAHQATLPADISELSELLTISRADLRRPYWSAPALTSAYLYYFLPWNLVRLCRLFSGLELPAPRRGRPSILIDLGSGPLTVALALWFARPEWREMPVEVVAVDCAGRPPHLGRDILERLAAKAHCEPWIVHSVQAPLDQAARRVSSLLPAGQRPWLVTAANVLNELPAEKRRGFDSDDEDSDEFSEAEGGRLESLLSSLFPLLRPGTGDQIPQLLFVEPGTRLGGSTLMEMRSLALQAGLHVKAPCLHDFACPLKKSDSFEDGADGEDPLISHLAGRTWCHFTFGCEGAPAWLEKLSAQAGLGKTSLSLSCLLLEAAGSGIRPVARNTAGDGKVDCPEEPEHISEQTPPMGEPSALSAMADLQTVGQTGVQCEPTGLQTEGVGKLSARIVSQPFAVPGLAGRCRYACSGKGLLLVEDMQACPAGSTITFPADCISQDGDRDKRSGAYVLRRFGQGACLPGEEKTGEKAAGTGESDSRREKTWNIRRPSSGGPAGRAKRGRSDGMGRESATVPSGRHQSRKKKGDRGESSPVRSEGPSSRPRRRNGESS